MEWTEERVAKLTELWNAGLSAAEISRRFGDVTRNAVIGKVHRLGLSGRPSPIKRAPQRPVVIATNSDRPCQWPFGDPGEPDFHFCGREAAPGRPYCPEHVARAYHRSDDRAEARDADKAA